MKQIIFVLVLLFQVTIIAQYDSIPSSIDTSGITEFSEVLVVKGENINFEFLTSFNNQVSMKLYSLEGELISTTAIEVFAEKGLALTTRSFEPATYFMCLKLKTKTIIKKVVIKP